MHDEPPPTRRRFGPPHGHRGNHPQGQPFELQEGQLAQITQALGSSFTLVVEGQLVRLRGDDADAIGKEPPESIVVPENVSTADIEPLIWETLKSCYDPEIPVNIVDLGLIYRCEVTPIDAHGDVQVVIDMTLHRPWLRHGRGHCQRGVRQGAGPAQGRRHHRKLGV